MQQGGLRGRGAMDGLKAPGGRWGLFVGGCEPNLSLAVPNGAGTRCHSMAVFLWVWGEKGGLGVLSWGWGRWGWGGGGPWEWGGCLWKSLGMGGEGSSVWGWFIWGSPGMGWVHMGVPRDGVGAYGGL